MTQVKLKIVLTGALLLLNAATHADLLADFGGKVIAASGTKPPVLVLSPGIKLNIGGRVGSKVVSVVGDDLCPKDFEDARTGAPARPGCTFLDKPVVTVHYVDAGVALTERWRVEIRNDRTRLIRPDGTLVSQAN